MQAGPRYGRRPGKASHFVADLISGTFVRQIVSVTRSPFDIHESDGLGREKCWLPRKLGMLISTCIVKERRPRDSPLDIFPLSY